MQEQNPSARPADQVIACTSPARFMQRVSDALRSGLVWYVQGTVGEAKWPRVEAKLRGRYPTLNRNRSFLHRERKAGRPAVRLLVLRPKGKAAGLVEFILVAPSPVEGDGERWRDAKRDRVKLWSYEAVRQTRPGQPLPAWTWRIEKGRYNALRSEIIGRVRRREDEALAALAASTKRWPGFAPVRKQHRALGLLLALEWTRSRRASEVPPAWPRLAYVRRLATR